MDALDDAHAQVQAALDAHPPERWTLPQALSVAVFLRRLPLKSCARPLCGGRTRLLNRAVDIGHGQAEFGDDGTECVDGN